MNTPYSEDEYDRSHIPECPKCGPSTAEVYWKEQFKNGQMKASCSTCGCYLKNLPKRRNQNARNAKNNVQIKRRKIKELGSSFCANCLRSEEFLIQNTGMGVVVHHIIEVHMGGGDELSNILLLCHECHESVHHLRRLLYPRYYHPSVIEKYHGEYLEDN